MEWHAARVWEEDEPRERKIPDSELGRRGEQPRRDRAYMAEE